jgi:hypothetical protein
MELSAGRYLLLEQNGPRAVVVSGWPLRVERIIQLESGRYFYGHGVAIVKENLVLTTEIEAEYVDRPGWIIFRAISDLRELGRIPSYGLNPHDICLLADTKTIAVANHGMAISEKWKNLHSNLALIEWESGRLVNDFQIEGEGVFASHLATNQLGDLIISTRKSKLKPDAKSRKARELLSMHSTREEGVRNFSKTVYFEETNPYLFLHGTNRLIPLASPQYGISQMRHSLSTAFDISGQFLAISHIENNLVTVWEKNTQKCVARIYFPGEQAHGIARGRNVAEFFITTTQGRLFRYSHLSDYESKLMFLSQIKSGLHLATATV